jgi:hypothetical protein
MRPAALRSFLRSVRTASKRDGVGEGMVGASFEEDQPRAKQERKLSIRIFSNVFLSSWIPK